MKNPAIEKLVEDVGIKVFGISPTEARSKGLCVQCKEPAISKCYSEAGRREYRISGMCETCFDSLFDNDCD